MASILWLPCSVSAAGVRRSGDRIKARYALQLLAGG
eukprot:COSAG05_NODE_16048_length_354_cov_2.231373_1_plen_35_part_10